MARREPAPRGRSRAGGVLLGLTMAVGSASLAAADDDAAARREALVLSPEVEAELAQLAVATPGDGDDFERSLFRHWVDVDDDRCDTREEVLIIEAVLPATVDAQRCTVTGGEWLSIYDGVEVDNPRSLDIDHMVPLKEAWRSGASEWTPEEREAYANDLEDPFALIAVTATTNRSKADRDPARWQPPNESSWCAYATAWLQVKLKYELSADQDEVAALRQMLGTC